MRMRMGVGMRVVLEGFWGVSWVAICERLREGGINLCACTRCVESM